VARGVDDDAGGNPRAVLGDHAGDTPPGPVEQESADGHTVPDRDRPPGVDDPVQGGLERRAAAGEGDEFVVVHLGRTAVGSGRQGRREVQERRTGGQRGGEHVGSPLPQQADAQGRKSVRVPCLRNRGAMPVAVRRGGAFEDLHLVSGVAEGEGGGQPGDAASHDDGGRGHGRHTPCTKKTLRTSSTVRAGTGSGHRP
jgi:hypothetical protein